MSSLLSVGSLQNEKEIGIIAAWYEVSGRTKQKKITGETTDLDSVFSNAPFSFKML